MAAQLQPSTTPVLDILRQGPLTFDGIKSRSNIPERDLWRIVDGYCTEVPPLLNRMQVTTGVWKYQLSIEAKRRLNIPVDFSDKEFHVVTVAPGPRGVIVKELAKQPMTVKEIAKRTGLTVQQVNYHLDRLGNKCLLAPVEREGRSMVYRLKTTPKLVPAAPKIVARSFDPTDWRFWFMKLCADPLAFRREEEQRADSPPPQPQLARKEKPHIVIIGGFPKWEAALREHYGSRFNLSIVVGGDDLSRRQLETLARQYKLGARVLRVKSYTSHNTLYFLRNRSIKHTVVHGWLSSLCRELDLIK